MKKLLFQKFLTDTSKIFIIISISIGLIVWVIQAVGFLDFVTEDGHGLYVYFYYTLLNFPKIIHRILPFVFFISLFYQISQYESKNELLVFWTHGVNKKNFMNVVIFYSIIVMFFQILIGSLVSPISQNKAKSFIRDSNIDFFPSLIKEGKFIDTVSDLTIFIESKDKSGVYQNIFLNDTVGGGKKNKNNRKSKKSQVIYAKKGVLIDNGIDRYFKLSEGKIINNDNGRATSFAFDTFDFSLNKFTSKTTVYPKIQETNNRDLIGCAYYTYKKKVDKFKAEFLDCQISIVPNVRQEIFKRFYQPFYIPLIALICCVLICVSKESSGYNKFKIILFLILIFIIIISEISLRYSTTNNLGLINFIFFPIISFLITYTFLTIKFKA